MFTLMQLCKEIKTVCSSPLPHVKEMRAYALCHPEDAGYCKDAVCPGCDIPAQALRWCGVNINVAW